MQITYRLKPEEMTSEWLKFLQNQFNDSEEIVISVRSKLSSQDKQALVNERIEKAAEIINRYRNGEKGTLIELKENEWEQLSK